MEKERPKYEREEISIEEQFVIETVLQDIKVKNSDPSCHEEKSE